MLPPVDPYRGHELREWDARRSRGPLPDQDEGRVARGFRLAGAAWDELVRDPKLCLLPLAALIAAVPFLVAIFWPALALAAEHGHRAIVLFVALMISSYPVGFVTTFFEVALVSILAARWRGEPATIADGLRAARGRLGVIAAWTLVSGTIGGVLGALERLPLGNAAEKVAAIMADFAWTVATFFVIPVLALHGTGPLQTVRLSARAIRHRWREGISGAIPIGAATAILLIPGTMLLTAGYGVFGHSHVDGVIVMAIGAAFALPVIVMSSALSEIFTLAVYRYAADGEVAGPFREADLARPTDRDKPGWLARWRARRRSR